MFEKGMNKAKKKISGYAPYMSTQTVNSTFAFLRNAARLWVK